MHTEERHGPADWQYLYLLFDDRDTSRLTNRVFTTEGHLLSLPFDKLRPPSKIRKAMHRGENLYCPKYEPPTLNGLTVGIEQRTDYEYARSLVFGWGVEGRAGEDKSRVHWSESGFCAVPQVPQHVSAIFPRSDTG